MRDLAHLLELYIRNPDALRPEQRREVADRIATDDTWREAWAFWTEFYSIAEEPRAIPRAIPLRPFKSGSVAPPDGITLLAARGPAAARRHTAIALLESEDGETLARFLWDGAAKELYAFVVGDVVSEMPILYVPHFGTAFLIDEGGRSAVLQSGGDLPNVENLLDVLLCVPAALARVGGAIELDSGDAQLRLTHSGDTLVGHLTTESRGVVFVAVFRNSGTTLHRLKAGSVSFPDVDENTVLRLYHL